MSAVVVDSEKGSRLSLPSAARAPLTGTGTSNATGCCLMAVSPVEMEVDEGFCDGYGLAVEMSLSLTVGGMGCTLARLDFRTYPAPCKVPGTIYMFPLSCESQP